MNILCLIHTMTQPKILNIKSQLSFVQYTGNQNKMKYSWTFQGHICWFSVCCNYFFILQNCFNCYFVLLLFLFIIIEPKLGCIISLHIQKFLCLVNCLQNLDVIVHKWFSGIRNKHSQRCFSWEILNSFVTLMRKKIGRA